jgi:hypothetical protein
MNDEREKWMEDVFQSMKGSRRATPGPELFAKIEGQIEASNGKIIPMPQWRYAAAAAALVLVVNVTALVYYNQNAGITQEEVAVASVYSESLISNYQIYE